MKKYILLIMLLLASSGYAADFTFSNDLRVGGRGQDVTELQSFLISNGYDIPAISAGTAQKGYFGLQTKLAVQKYQSAQGLPSTGFVGPLTRGKLNGRGIITALNVISPNGGEVWKRGTTQTIKWNAPAYLRATYADITLQPYINYPVCTGEVCPMYAESAMYPYRPPYTIAKGISIDNHSYSWKVGDAWLQGNPGGAPDSLNVVPDGQYKIQICEQGSNNCAISNKPFTITSTTTSNLPPVINGIDAPTTLSVGQTGTWIVRATDPENGALSYSVRWGDVPGAYISSDAGTSATNSTFVQNATFTHSYTSAGTYTVKFTAQDNAGNQTQSSVTVQVNGSSPTITILSPKNNDSWISKSVQQIKWDYKNVDSRSTVDITLEGIIGCTENMNMDCTTPVYVLDKNIPINQIYNWIVATDINDKIIPPREYQMIICVSGTKTCYRSAIFHITPQYLPL